MNGYRLSINLVMLICVCSNAEAQNSVTLYGTLDDALTYYNNVGAHSLIQMQGGGQDDNRWGIKGEEDLGSGTKAVFALENGFVINNGTLDQNGREFGRQAYVGLLNDAWGTLTLGRQNDPTVDLVQPITADGYGAAFSTPGDADNNDNSVWVNNAVKYLSPNYAGFQYELLYGFGGVPGSTTSGQTYSAAVSFTNGGFSAAGGYFFAKNDGSGGAGSSDPIADNTVTPLSGAIAFVGSRQIVQAAVQYVLADFTANARYSNAQYKPYRDVGAFDRTETFNIGAVSLGWQATNALLLAVGYTYTRSSGNASATYNSAAATTQYGLSKRTNLYATVGYTHASGTSYSTDSNIVPAGGAVADLASTSGTPTQVALMLGIVHRF